MTAPRDYLRSAVFNKGEKVSAPANRNRRKRAPFRRFGIDDGHRAIGPRQTARIYACASHQSRWERRQIRLDRSKRLGKRGGPPISCHGCVEGRDRSR